MSGGEGLGDDDKLCGWEDRLDVVEGLDGGGGHDRDDEQSDWLGELVGARSDKDIGEDERPANGVRLTSRTSSTAHFVTT